MNTIHQLIKDICEEENIKFNLISNDWIIVLEKENKIHYISGTKFDLNNYVSANICNDKYACFSALKYNNIPVCEHHILYKETKKEEIEEIFNNYNKDVVLKKNIGSYGIDMYHIKDIDELINKLNELFVNNKSVSILPYYKIKSEYRVIVLNNEVELIYGKKRPVVIGDGIHTVYELLLNFNKPFFKDINHEELDYILEKDKIYEYSWQHNISKGAIPYKINDNSLIERLTNIAVNTTKKLNLNFVSVDIVELDNNDLKVIEVNSGVVTNIADYFEDGDEIAYRIYKKAILSMFVK